MCTDLLWNAATEAQAQELGLDLTPVSQTDLERLRQQLKRPPRGVVAVAARRKSGDPQVVATAPRLENGEPFPTAFYLTDTELIRAASRLEAEHFMAELSDLLACDQDLATAYSQAHQQYLRQRELIGQLAGTNVPEPIQEVSAGGMPTRIKCLHALLAHHLAATNPIGALAEAKAIEMGIYNPA